MTNAEVELPTTPGLFFRAEQRERYVSIRLLNRTERDIKRASLTLEFLQRVGRWPSDSGIASTVLNWSSDERLAGAPPDVGDLRIQEPRSIDLIAPQNEYAAGGTSWVVVAANSNVRPTLSAGRYRAHLTLAADGLAGSSLTVDLRLTKRGQGEGSQRATAAPTAWQLLSQPSADQGSEPPRLVASPDYRRVEVEGTAYSLSENRALVVRILREAGRPLHEREIFALLPPSVASATIPDIFGKSGLIGTLVVREAPATYRLSAY
jgi:hypothetical protein